MPIYALYVLHVILIFINFYRIIFGPLLVITTGSGPEWPMACFFFVDNLYLAISYFALSGLQ